MKAGIAILSTPTTESANIPPKTFAEHLAFVRSHVEQAYQVFKNNWSSDCVYLFLFPEFHTRGVSSKLFQQHDTKKHMLAAYKLLSQAYPHLVLMPTFNYHSSKLKNDEDGEKLKHKDQIHKINAVYALLNGEEIFRHYKKHLSLKDIPDQEIKNFEVERNTYLSKLPKAKKVPIPGVFQVKGVIIGVDICLDFAFSHLKTVLENHYQRPFDETMGVDIHLLISGTYSNYFLKQNEFQNLACKDKSFFVQADGAADDGMRENRNGVWKLSRKKHAKKIIPDMTITTSNKTSLYIHSVNLTSSPPTALNAEVPNYVNKYEKSIQPGYSCQIL